MTNIVDTSIKTLSLPQEFVDLRNQADKEFLLKSLIATAFLIASICAIIFLSSIFLVVGVAIILTSSLAMYHHLDHHWQSRNVFIRTERDIRKTLGPSSQTPV